jgi:hypothetical protein
VTSKGDTSAIREIREALEGKSERPIADDPSPENLFSDEGRHAAVPTVDEFE